MPKFPIAVAALAGTACLAAGCGSERAAPKLPPPLTQQQLIDRASKGVVAIKAETKDGAATGTGWVVSPREIMTAAHVVNGAEDIEVRFNDGSVVAAQVVGESVCNDRALLKLSRSVPNLTVLPIADGSLLENNTKLDLLHYGSSAAASAGKEQLTTSPLTVANPRVLDPNLGPKIPKLTDLIQLQGVVPRGASGGAVLDADGLVRGMAVVVETSLPQAYALPVGPIRKALAGLRDGDRSDSLGVELTTMAAVDLEALFAGDPVYESDSDWLSTYVADTLESSGQDGLFIQSVAEDGPAKDALYFGNLITEANGVEIHSMEDLCGAIQSAGPGEEIAVDGVRISSGISLDDVLADWSATVRLRP